MGAAFRYFRRIRAGFCRGNPNIETWGKYYHYDRFLDTLLQLGSRGYEDVLDALEQVDNSILADWKRGLWLEDGDRHDEWSMDPLPCEGLPIDHCILACYLCRHMDRHPNRYTERKEHMHRLPPQTRFVGRHSLEDYHRALLVWHKYALSRMARIKFRFEIPDSYWTNPKRTLRFIQRGGPDQWMWWCLGRQVVQEGAWARAEKRKRLARARLRRARKDAVLRRARRRAERIANQTFLLHQQAQLHAAQTGTPVDPDALRAAHETALRQVLPGHMVDAFFAPRGPTPDQAELDAMMFRED